MTFLRKNWAKLATVTAALVGVVLTIILLIKGPVKDLTLVGFEDDMVRSESLKLVAQLIFFSSIIIYLLLRLFNATKKSSGYVLLVLSLAALILLIFSVTEAAAYVNDASDKIQNGLALAETLPGGILLPIPGFGEITKEAFINRLEVSRFKLTTATYMSFMNMIIFAIVPMIYSLKKILKKRARKN